MYCSHCGKEVLNEAYVCPACGCKIAGNDDRLSSLSIVGFVLAFLMPLIGFVVSIIANSCAKHNGDEKSATFAKAGTVIAACLMIIYILVIVVSGIFIGSVIISNMTVTAAVAVA